MTESAAPEPGCPCRVTVRVGVIGAGIMGADHARTLHRLVSGAAVTLVADVGRGPCRSGGRRAARRRVSADAVRADRRRPRWTPSSSPRTTPPTPTWSSPRSRPASRCCARSRWPQPSPSAQRVVAAEDAAVGDDRCAADLARLHAPVRPRLLAAASRALAGGASAGRCWCTASAAVSPQPRAQPTNRASPARPSTSSTCCHGCSAPRSPRSAGTRPGRSAAGVGLQDPQVMLLRTADGVLSTVEVFLNAPLRLRRPLRDRRRGRRSRPRRAGADGDRPGPRPVRRVPRRLAAPVRRRLPRWSCRRGSDGSAPAQPIAAWPPRRTACVAGRVADAVLASMHGDGAVSRSAVPADRRPPSLPNRVP